VPRCLFPALPQRPGRGLIDDERRAVERLERLHPDSAWSFVARLALARLAGEAGGEEIDRLVAEARRCGDHEAADYYLVASEGAGAVHDRQPRQGAVAVPGSWCRQRPLNGDFLRNLGLCWLRLAERREGSREGAPPRFSGWRRMERAAQVRAHSPLERDAERALFLSAAERDDARPWTAARRFPGRPVAPRATARTWPSC
jgi:hypothetical protein